LLSSPITIVIIIVIIIGNHCQTDGMFASGRLGSRRDIGSSIDITIDRLCGGATSAASSPGQRLVDGIDRAASVCTPVRRSASLVTSMVSHRPMCCLQALDEHIVHSAVAQQHDSVGGSARGARGQHIRPIQVLHAPDQLRR
jgi:hypothetical protein